MKTEKTTHTPGPWTITDNGQYVRNLNDGIDYVVASVNWSATDEGKANARIIAAAPELLAALRGLLADKYLSDPINADRMAQARAAIAKAQGR